MADKIFYNRNGYYTIEEMLEFKKMSYDNFINYLRTFSTLTNKCPPIKLKCADCFRCIDCWKLARETVNEKMVK